MFKYGPVTRTSIVIETAFIKTLVQTHKSFYIFPSLFYPPKRFFIVMYISLPDNEHGRYRSKKPWRILYLIHRRAAIVYPNGKIPNVYFRLIFLKNTSLQQVSRTLSQSGSD